MRITTERILTHLKHVAHFALNAGVTYPGLWYVLARIQERCVNPVSAARTYARAIASADRSGNRNMFKVRQHWQFCMERALHDAGAARVEDPLFSCKAAPSAQALVSPQQRRRAPGHYEARWRFRGLRIDGFLDSRQAVGKTIRVLLDGQLLREVTVAKAPFIPPYFQLTLQRSTIADLPMDSMLRVETAEGTALLFDGASATQVHVPHGSELICRNRSGVDKKGFPTSIGEELESRQRALLDIYAKAREAFAREIDKPLFLIYGTLLGFHRNGDFIPGDDDFDVGYISGCASPEAVKREAMDIVVRLVLSGFMINFNRNGRLFRLRLPTSPPDTHLDVHTVWFEGRKAWVHPQARLECSAGDFLPVAHSEMRGVPVAVPRNPEAFLSAYYGAGWRTPDPAYASTSRHIPGAVLRHLARALVTPLELRRMQHDIAARAGDVLPPGRLVSIGSHSLYPLDEYERNCDW
jgi:hypothetical protein